MVSLSVDNLIPYIALGLVTAFGWWMHRSFTKAMNALDAIPGLIVELKSIADEMKESKVQLAKINVLESVLATAFKRIDELRVDNVEQDEMNTATIEIMRMRIHEISNILAVVQGKLELHLQKDN